MQIIRDMNVQPPHTPPVVNVEMMELAKGQRRWYFSKAEIGEIFPRRKSEKEKSVCARTHVLGLRTRARVSAGGWGTDITTKRTKPTLSQCIRQGQSRRASVQNAVCLKPRLRTVLV